MGMFELGPALGKVRSPELPDSISCHVAGGPQSGNKRVRAERPKGDAVSGNVGRYCAKRTPAKGSRQVQTVQKDMLDWWQDQQQEFRRAWEIQRDLLPKNIPPLPGCQISGRCQPARAVGGDYFDVLKFTDGTVGLCIADAAGKGIPAALLMANLQSGVKLLASPSLPPKELCQRVNSLVCNNVTPGKFITLFYCLLDTHRRSLVYANAGHNPPMLLRRDDTVLRLCEGGLLLGFREESRYQQGEVDIAPGDWILLFTDGLTEGCSADDEQFGEERLLSLLAANRELEAAELQKKVIQAVEGFSGGCLEDDMTLVVVRVE